VLEVTDKKNPLETYAHGRKVREHVRDFGSLFALIGVIIAAVIIYRGGSDAKALIIILASAAFGLMGALTPQVLHPLWKLWMGIAEKLSVVMTFLILMIAWCLLVVPMAFILRILRVKVMDMSFKTEASSYWEVRPERVHNFKLLERQF
jgi:membrane associated rhomboid family serine protease